MEPSENAPLPNWLETLTELRESVELDKGDGVTTWPAEWGEFFTLYRIQQTSLDHLPGRRRESGTSRWYSDLKSFDMRLAAARRGGRTAQDQLFALWQAFTISKLIS